MKLNYSTNLCKKCFGNVAEIIVKKSPLSNEKIEVCWDCYYEFYDPELFEEETINSIGEIDEEH